MMCLVVRSKLIDVALFAGGMSGHWLTGYGAFADPGWGPLLDGRNRTDAVNHYILVLARYGLIGLIPFLAMCTIAARRLIDAYKASLLDSDKWLIWTLAGGLFGVLLAFNSVSLFGQPTTIFYMMIGFCGIMPMIVTKIRNPYLLRNNRVAATSSIETRTKNSRRGLTCK